MCRERNFNVFQCDCLNLPLKSDIADGVISIAVIHHLASDVTFFFLLILIFLIIYLLLKFIFKGKTITGN